MGWHYRLPQAFPAMYPVAIRTALQQLGEPVLLTYGTKGEVEVVAEKFRWFKWCIREDPGAFMEFATVFDDYDIRTSSQYSAGNLILYVTAKPTKVSEFIRLNPELADEVLPDCQ